MTGYYILVAFLALSIGASLSVTFLFNIKEIVVIGSSQYDNIEIIKASDISTGDNLIRLNTKTARSRILSEMLYMDDVVIRKKFPDKLEMELYPSKEMAYVEYKSGYIIISEKWRVLEDVENTDGKNLLMITGFEPKSGEPKSTMESMDKDKEGILQQMLGYISSLEIKDITSIDINDKYDIRLNYADRINIIIGNSKDIEYKLKYAYHILTNELRANKSGYLIYHDSLGYSYVSEEEYNQINNKLQDGKNTQAVNGDVSEITGIVTDVSENVPNNMEVTDFNVQTAVPVVTEEDETEPSSAVTLPDPEVSEPE